MTKRLMVGGVPVGGGAPVSIQSMCNTKTDDVEATVSQILALEEAGGAAVLLEAECSGQALFQAACGILRDEERLRAMEEAMASLGIRDAAERIYQTVLEIQK